MQEQCAHANKTDVAEQASTCSEKGWDAYKKCADCGQIFSADGGTELIEPPIVALQTIHTAIFKRRWKQSMTLPEWKRIMSAPSAANILLPTRQKPRGKN